MVDMFIEVKQDLSMIYFIKDLFDTTYGAGFVTVGAEWPDLPLASNKPYIAVKNEALTVKALELGNRYGYDMRIWYFDIFANDISQRDVYGYAIKNAVQGGVPVLDFALGFPPEDAIPQIGAMSHEEIRVRPIPVMSELTSPQYWRGQVYLLARYTVPTNT